MKFYKIEYHDFMSLYPDIEVIIGENLNTVKKNVAQIKEVYNSGTVNLIGEMSKEEARAHILSVLDKEVQNPQNDSEEFKKKIINAYWDCYATYEEAQELIKKYLK